MHACIACVLTRHTNASTVDPRLFVLQMQGNMVSPMPTYAMPTGTVPTSTIITSGYAPAYSAPTYAYAVQSPPVQHVRRVVYQEGAWPSAGKHNEQE